MLIESVFFMSYFSSSFPYLFYRLMRPLSKVETRRGRSISLLGLCIFPPSVFALFCVLCRSSEFLNWTFILKQPDVCAATSFIFGLSNVPCLLLLLVCLYVRNNKSNYVNELSNKQLQSDQSLCVQ